MESASLRPITDDDLPPVLEMESRLHVAPWSEKHLRAEMEKPYSHILVLTDDETDSRIFGFIVFWLLHEDCQILNVVVDLPYRGQGLAKRMVRQAISLATREGAKRALLDVRKDNLPAVQLYQALGFTITRVQKAYYSNGEDAYQMALELEGEKDSF